MVDACHAQGVPEPEYELLGGEGYCFQEKYPDIAQTDPELIQSGPEVAQTVYNDDCCHEEVLGVIRNRTDLYNKT
jgi:hypothetical protein